MMEKQPLVFISADEAESRFLKELSELTIKYNIEIMGCGCCGSPSLEITKGEASYTTMNSFYRNDDKLEFVFECKNCHKIEDVFFNRYGEDCLCLECGISLKGKIKR